MDIFEQTLMDQITIILRRGGLSPRTHCSNELSVYKIDEENEFGGSHEPRVYLRGYVHFQSDITIRCPGTYTARVVVDLANPNYHIDLLKFFGVEDYEFEVFKDHDVFAHL